MPQVSIPTVTCPKCSYVWTPRIAVVRRCPNCFKRLK